MLDNIINEITEKYNSPKKRNIEVSLKFPKSHKQHNQIGFCASSMFATIFQHKDTAELKKNLSFFTCKSKFCPVCNMIKQNRWSVALYKKSKELQEVEKQRFLFMTLTVENCKLEDLSETVKRMSKAWNKLYDRELQFRFNGFLRALEFTISKDEDGQIWIHPHFHILLSANKSYFYKSNKKYISTERLSQLWNRFYKQDQMPIVDIRIIKAKRKDNKIQKEALPAVIAELIKYPMKDTDYSKLNETQMVELYDQLFRKRLIASGGNLKVSINETNLGEENELDGELILKWQQIAYVVLKYFKGGYVVGGGQYFDGFEPTPTPSERTPCEDKSNSDYKAPS